MKYIKGMVCSVDPENKLNQDTTGIMAVELLNIVKKRHFGKTIWLCKNLDEYSNIKTIQVQERLLQPINMSLLRIPVDTPVINSNDLKVLSGAISYMESHNVTGAINDLKTLYEKLEFYNKFREV